MHHRIGEWNFDNDISIKELFGGNGSLGRSRVFSLEFDLGKLSSIVFHDFEPELEEARFQAFLDMIAGDD